jgi:hypothetical protein
MAESDCPLLEIQPLPDCTVPRVTVILSIEITDSDLFRDGSPFGRPSQSSLEISSHEEALGDK